MRRDFPYDGPDALPAKTAYPLLTAIVVPRPIAWVTSRSSDGVDNLAPHSFYTVACANPPIVQFTSVGKKDTLRNVKETKEFVVHLTPERLFETINRTGSNQPQDISEIDDSRLTREPSAVVSVPRIVESPVAIECRLNLSIELGDSTVVMGDVVHIAIDEDVLDLSGKRPHPRIDLLRPLSRLGADEWGLLGEIREIKRPKWGDIS